MGEPIGAAHEVLIQLMSGPVWGGNIVCKTGLRTLRNLRVAGHDALAVDQYDGTRGCWVLKVTRGDAIKRLRERVEVDDG